MTVTLETLRADFEAARIKSEASLRDFCERQRCRLTLVETGEELYHKPFSFYLTKWQNIRCRIEAPDLDFEWYAEVDGELLLTAHVLDVAEKHGLEAAMLYKLSDGAIDPRVSNAAC